MVVGLTRLALRVSRPYYYLVTLWLYILPTGGHVELLTTPAFWLGVAYCTLPLNLMCYLMNDLADVDVDKHNERKGGELLGAKEDGGALRGRHGSHQGAEAAQEARRGHGRARGGRAHRV